ncbi:MAG: endonuclease/exonuclease/phosphatase family protein [Chitinophagales bacterium]
MILFLLLFILIVFAVIVVFYFWSSSGSVDQSQYSQVIKWENKEQGRNELVENRTYMIISYNIGYLSGMSNNLAVERKSELFESNLENVNAEINKLQPDFIAFQEIDYRAKRSYNIDQLEAIAGNTGFAYAARQINWDKNYLPFPYWPPKFHFGKLLSGQAVLSRYPVLEDKRIVLQMPEMPYYREAFYIDRLLQITKIDIDGQPLILMNVHLEAYDQNTRVAQAKKVLGYFRQYAKDYPVILAGDFNSDPIYSDVPGQKQEPTISFFLDTEDLEAASLAYYPIEKEKVKATFPADNPDVKLDYIFYTADRIEKIDFKVLEDFGTASDHLPVMMEFRFKP